MKKNRMICMLSLASLLAFSAGTFAQGPGKCGPKKDGPCGPMRGVGCLLENEECMSRLNITADQKKALEEISLRSEQEKTGLEAEAKTAHLALKTLMKSQSDDRDAIFKAMDEVSACQLKLKKAGMTAWLDAQSNLTEEQRTQIRKEMGAMRKGEMKNRDGKKCGGKKRGPECGKGRPGTMGCGPTDMEPEDAP